MVDKATDEQTIAADPNDPKNQSNRPIILTLTLGKVNYILENLAQLPYAKSYQPIQDIQAMVLAQMQEPYPPVDASANDAAATTDTAAA
jgi:hypothetical protein